MTKEIYFAVSVIALVMIIFTQPQYETTLFDKSLEIIPKLQAGASQFKIKAWLAYSNGALGLVIAAPIVSCLIIFNQRARAFYYVTMVGCILLIMNVSKLYYH